MSIEEIFELEERNEGNLYDIHFYMEGSFWRAYEWSAYLSRMFPSDLKEEERLKVLKKLPKGYDVWMGTSDYYLGKYNWTKVEQ